MKYKEVKSIPEITYKRKNKLQELIAEFMDDDIHQAEIECKPGEYKSPWICYQALWAACRRSGRRVTSVYRNGKVYLVKK